MVDYDHVQIDLNHFSIGKPKWPQFVLSLLFWPLISDLGFHLSWHSVGDNEKAAEKRSKIDHSFSTLLHFRGSY